MKRCRELMLPTAAHAALLLALCTVPARAQHAEAPAAAAHAGCYRLDAGAWRPALGPERERIFRLPDRVVLDAVRVEGGGARPRFLLRARRPELARTGRIPRAYWEVDADGAVALHWTTGAAGVDALLRPAGARLTGTARAWSRDGTPGRPGAVARVVARRVACGG